MVGNAIIDALAPDRRDALAEAGKERDLERAYVMFEVHRPVTHVYFPLTAVVSLVVETAAGASVEAAMVGHEGVVGTGVFLGRRDRSTWRAIVQIPGRAIELTADAFEAHIAEDPQLADAVRAYTFALMTQMAQTVACNRLHPAEDRLARWLSQARDTAGEELPLTQEFIAEMLGTRRATVTVAARTLQDEDIITYRRGHIRVLDPARLEERACECLDVIRAEYARVAEPATV